ncbi:MAG: hypothetical protein ABIM21_00425 [candidate division WOR-3 bacterium]
MKDEKKGPLWMYTIPPKTRVTIIDEKNNIVFDYINDTFFIKFLDKPFYIRPLWKMIIEKI